MPRTAILLTLTAATLFGPLLCCCALGFTCAARTLPEREPAKATACPHCLPAEPKGPEPAPSNKHDCPVCADRATGTIYVEVPSAPLPPAQGFVAWLPLDALLPVESAAARAAGVRPSPDVQSYFLDACHRLRC